MAKILNYKLTKKNRNLAALAALGLTGISTSSVASADTAGNRNQLAVTIAAANQLKNETTYAKATDAAKAAFDKALAAAVKTSGEAMVTDDELVDANVELSIASQNLKYSQVADQVDLDAVKTLIDKVRAVRDDGKFDNLSDTAKTKIVNALAAGKTLKVGSTTSEIEAVKDQLNDALTTAGAVQTSNVSSAASNTSSAASSTTSSSSSAISSNATSTTSSVTSNSSSASSDAGHTALKAAYDDLQAYVKANGSSIDTDTMSLIDKLFATVKDELTNPVMSNSQALEAAHKIENVIHADNSTDWVDTDGKTLKEAVKGYEPDDDGHSDIGGYTLVASKLDKDGNMVNVYKKDGTDQKTEASVTHTYYYDQNGHSLKDKTEGNNKDEIAGYTLSSRYTLTAADVASGGDFAGLGMQAGDVINLYKANNAASSATSGSSSTSSNASSASSNVSSVSSNVSSASSNVSSESSNVSSETSSTSSASSDISSASSNVSFESSSISSESSNVSSASPESESANVSSNASSDANSLTDDSSAVGNSNVAGTVAGVPANTAGQTTAGTLPQTGDKQGAVLSALGALTILATGTIIKKRKTE